MTVPTSSADHAAERTAVTPARILSSVAILLVLFMIFAPQPISDNSATFSSYGPGRDGSRALYDVLSRLGFRTRRSDTPIHTSPDSGSVYVLLHASQPLTASERAKVVTAVWHGAVLVFTTDAEALADSLHFDVTAIQGFYTLDQTAVAGGNPPLRHSSKPTDVMFHAPVAIDGVVQSEPRVRNESFLWIDPKPRSPAPSRDSIPSPGEVVDSASLMTVVRGHSFGAGYAVAIAVPAIVTNQAMHDPRPIIAIVHAIEFGCSRVAHGKQCSSVVFDEYHHGFGHHADVLAAIKHALTDTAPGRAMTGLIAAALILLLSYAVRPLAPVARPAVSRRSPLEHVGALAHAYAQLDSRRLGNRRLMRGLRRRHPLGLPVSVPDDTYLSALRNRLPAVQSSVDTLAAALSSDSHGSLERFATTGDAIANIERAFPK